MCAQVVCEIPDECMAGANPCGDAPVTCDAYCPAKCDPCQAPIEFPPCPPGGDCSCRCECNEFSSCCYQQPARVQPIRPIANILRSTAPMDSATIYKRSYFANCGDCYRAKPIRPCPNITSANGRMECCTVQKLSYMPPCAPGRTAAIRPPENGLKFCGPLYAMTSQKHDFVPKCYSKRDPIKPPNGIWPMTAPLERCTINKLSYMPVDVCQNPPPKPITQGYNYQRPTGPGERCTVQKLSYLPVCLPAKEPMPWAEKHRLAPPPYQNLCTTYNLSYLPSCCVSRQRPITPLSGLKSLGTDFNDGHTVYKLSYMPVNACCFKPDPIRPSGGIAMPTGPMEKCTVQKLSYQPNCCVARTKPVRPQENGIKPAGPLYCMTTQKHDFVPKPICRRSPIKPPAMLSRATGGLEKCTINKLSYMPVNVCEYRRPAAVLPRPGVCRADGPIEKCTTYKLSYLPNCPPQKEPMPWANKAPYCRPTVAMEKCTIQKLSYGPPGNFARCGTCCTTNAPSAFPKAGICN